MFAHDIRAAGVEFATVPATGPDAERGTARCLILVSPDAQRTMNTYLGVAALVGPDDVDVELLSRARVVYCEGYLWDEPIAKAALRKAMDAAHEVGTPVVVHACPTASASTGTGPSSWSWSSTGSTSCSPTPTRSARSTRSTTSTRPLAG